MAHVRHKDERFELSVEGGVEGAMPLKASESSLLRAMSGFMEATGGTCGGALRLLTTGTVRQREIACHVVGRLRYRPAAQPLVDLLARYVPRGPRTRRWYRGDPGEMRVLRSAAFAVQELRDPRCVPALLELLRHPEAQRRGMAALALGWKANHAAVDGLLRLLADPDCMVRGDAAAALGDIGNRDAVDGLASHLQRGTSLRGTATDAPVVETSRCGCHGTDSCELSEVTWALGALRDDTAVDVLTSVLDAPESDISCWAAGALAEIGSARARDALAERLDATDPARVQVARSLAKARDPSVFSTLEEMLRHDQPDTRHDAILGLKDLGGRAAVRLLLRALDDPESWVREAAVGALGSLRARRATRSLMALVAQESHTSRLWAQAVEALGQIRAREAVPMLLGKVRNHRYYVVSALASIGDPRAVPVLVAALRHRDKELRVKAARALGRMGAPTAIPGLRALLADPWPSVRHAARRVLQEFR